MKKALSVLLILIAFVLISGFVWASMIYGVVNVCFDYDFSFRKEMLLGVIFQTALLFIRSIFKGRD